MSIFEYKVGMWAGTTDTWTPLGRLIKIGGGQLAHVLSPDIATHCVCVARWWPRYQDIIDNNELRYSTKIKTPNLRAGQLCFIEATWPRCRWVPLSYYPMRRSLLRHVVYVADCSPERDEEEFNMLLWSFVGKPYQLSVFLQMFGAPNRDPRDDQEYCSEVNAHLLAVRHAAPSAEWLRYGVLPVQIQAHSEARGWVKWRCGYDPKKLFGGEQWS